MHSAGFTPEERATLARFLTDPDGDVFALVGLPEVVKGALFARYSRYGGSLKRLLLDEFIPAGADTTPMAELGTERAERLYQRVFDEYGDDSVAQLGGAHLAVENVSNLITKQLEWHRLAAYLEQSTRYIPYDTRPWRYHLPAELTGALAAEFAAAMEEMFTAYAEAFTRTLDRVREWHPEPTDEPPGPWRAATRAKALDLVRGMLPAATTANLGIFATGQTYELMLLRLRSLELAEARTVADRMLRELRKVIPSFLVRVDRPDRGQLWTEYLATTRAAVRELATRIVGDRRPEPVPEVTLVDWWPRDPEEAERELVAAILYSATDLPETQLARLAAELSAEERAAVVRAYVGTRSNRRHKPGRAFERLWYRFDILADYGAFRDLQRHRMLTIEWQPLTVRHGYRTPPELADAGVEGLWHRALERSAALYERLVDTVGPTVAQYAVAFAYRVRYVVQLNAREAMHLIELRSSPQGHPDYRRVVLAMHRAIAEVAGHRLVADAMTHVHREEVALERLEAERRTAARRSRRQA